MHNISEISENVKQYRYLSNLTQEELAARSGIALPTIKKIEGGKPGIRMSTIESLALALDIETSALIQPARRLKTIRFRSCKNMRSRESVVSVIINKLDKYNQLEKVTGDYIGADYKNIPHFDDPVAFANACRKLADLDNISPIHNITNVVYKLGIKLFNIIINTDKFFSLSVGEEDGGPAIIVNINKRISYEQAVFSLSHELGHLLMHRNIEKHIDDEIIWAEEDEADLFASHFLMPEAGFHQHWQECQGLHWTDKVIKIKHIYTVHYKTVLHRLLNCYVAEGITFRELNNRFIQEYEGTIKDGKEPEPVNNQLYLEERMYTLAVTAVKDKKLTVDEGAAALKISKDKMKRLEESLL